MKHILLFVTLFLIALTAKGQSVLYYEYDASGNRIQRSTSSLRSGDQIPKASAAITDVEILGDVKIYPNPVRNILEIETGVTSGNETVRVLISDISGKQIGSAEGMPGNLRLDMTPYPSGVYLLTVTCKNEAIHRKIIKE